MTGNDGQASITADEIHIAVPARLIAALPADVLEDDHRREVYLLAALEIGIQAIAHAGVHLDTKIVADEFQRLEAVLHRMHGELEKLLCQELTDDDSRLARALKDYLADEGRLARMVKQLCAELGDPSREGSIPGRVRKLLDDHFRDADSPFQRALNISDDGSPLKRFVQDQERKLEELKDYLTRSHTNLSRAISDDFRKVFDHIGYKSELAEAEAKGTRKGGTFEDRIAEFLSSVVFDKDAAERVGEELIDGTRRKRGDVLIRVQQEGVGEGRIVVEAKAGGHAIGGREGVLTQLREAMDFRQASGGIVVVTKEYAGKRQRTFDRRGSDRIIVVVDPDDEERGFLPLEVAYAVLRERILAVQRREAEGHADFQEMENAVTRIENALAAVQSMKVNCTAAKGTIDALRTSIEEMEDVIRDQLRTLRQQVSIEAAAEVAVMQS